MPPTPDRSPRGRHQLGLGLGDGSALGLLDPVGLGVALGLGVPGGVGVVVGLGVALGLDGAVELETGLGLPVTDERGVGAALLVAGAAAKPVGIGDTSGPDPPLAILIVTDRDWAAEVNTEVVCPKPESKARIGAANSMDNARAGRRAPRTSRRLTLAATSL